MKYYSNLIITCKKLPSVLHTKQDRQYSVKIWDYMNFCLSWHVTKMRSGADLNGDNLRISGAYLWISDHCRVTVRVRLGFGLWTAVYKLLEKVTKCISIT